MQNQRHEILIIGAGLAGLYAALQLAPSPVVVLSPCPVGDGASSAWAQGGVAAAMDDEDTAAAHAKDTISAGDGIVLPEIAKIVTEAAHQHIKGLTEIGTPFDMDHEGDYVMSKEAAHSWPRVVRVKGDQAGAAIMAALIKEVRKTPSITIMEGWSALELLSHNGKMQGVVAAGPDNETCLLQAKAYLLAAGGTGSLFLRTTNPPNVRGLALGMAARTGAKINDAEFVQFHPTAIDLDRDPAPLATEALRGEGAILVNKDKNRFMQDVHPDAELAPRDIVARAIFAEHRAGNRPALDTREAIGEHILTEFPAVSSACSAGDIDPVNDVIPVVPAAHYHMGGVSSDAHGQSSIKGLWVAGEAASTGLHGANRLASNGLLEALVFASLCADNIGDNLADIPDITYTPRNVNITDPDVVSKLRKTMSEKVGVLRDAHGLSEALRIFRELDEKHSATCSDLANMIAAATIIAASALKREESRGGHFRTDFPDKNHSLAQRSEITLAEAITIRDAQ